MGQFRQFNTVFSISDTDITITSNILGNQVSDIVLRDGSMDTNFKTKIAAHRDVALSLGPTATTPPCSVFQSGRWIKIAASGTITTLNTKIIVPPGNSGVLTVNFDGGGFTLKYSKNGSSVTTISDGGTVTVANNDTLAFNAITLSAQESVEGYVTDSDTGVRLDVIKILNSTPA